MTVQTTTTKQTDSCGQQFTVKFMFNGYAEWPVFYIGNKGHRVCPKCGRLLIYQNPSIL
jgi:hypothetical protein